MSAYEISILEQWAEKIRPIAQKHQPELFRQLVDALQEKKAAESVDITVYGIYSHGKSTLVNALCGAESAKMGIAPTTAVVQRYPWRGYHLLDTPGIDAPIEHQAIAEEQLRKSELVIYVLQSTDLDDARAWKELADNVERRQKTILVVNDFNQCRTKPELMTRLKDGYRTNLQKEGAARGINSICDYVPIYFVNAKSALKGKLENKEILLAASGINELEHAIHDAVRNVSAHDVIQTLKRNFIDLLRLCESSLCPVEKSVIFNEAQASLREVSEVRNAAALKIQRDLEGMLATYRGRIYTLFESTHDEQLLRNQLSDIMEEVGGNLEECIRKTLSHAKKRVEDICDNIDKLSSVYVDTTAVADDTNATISEVSTLQTLPWKDMLQHVNWEESINSAVIKILEMGKKFLPKIFKGIGKKTMAKWASRLTAALGPILTAGIAVYEFYSAVKEEEGNKNAAINRAKALEDAVNSVITTVQNTYADEMKCILDDVFLPVEQNIEGKIQDLRIQFMLDERDVKLLKQAEEAIGGILTH